MLLLYEKIISFNIIYIFKINSLKFIEVKNNNYY